MATFNFTTGPATLPDVGELSYNGCNFSPLFETKVSSAYIKDAANRTVKEIEYTITVSGYVTLPDGSTNVESTLATLERLLSAPAGVLRYTGRGIKIIINTAAGDKDSAWGPFPEILDIVPMGAGRSAKIEWTVKTRIPTRAARRAAADDNSVLQFNYETGVSYDDAGYSQLRVSGVIEIPLTRISPTNRTVPYTVDRFREQFLNTLIHDMITQQGVTRFRPTRRDFTISRDKRTLEFRVEVEELPWMAMPAGITVARGQFTFKPARAGVGLCSWLCSLNVTYTVPNGQPRRTAWLAFLALLRHRMHQGDIFAVAEGANANQNPPPPANNNALRNNIARILLPGFGAGYDMRIIYHSVMRNQAQVNNAQQRGRSVWLIDLSGTEGLYLDSKTVTFSATWKLMTVFSEILLASGIWTNIPDATNNVWATSVRDIVGYKSWLENRLDPTAQAIVDFGVH